jgi:hypothetical protein
MQYPFTIQRPPALLETNVISLLFASAKSFCHNGNLVKEVIRFLLLCLWLGFVTSSYAIFNAPAVITYQDLTGKQRFFVFAEGNTHHLVVNWWDGTLWHWSDQGVSPGSTQVFQPSAVSYQAASGDQRFFVFTEASNSHLAANWWDGTLWHWSDQGLPPGAAYVLPPSAVTYRDAAGKQHFFVFAEGNNRHLTVNWWDGALWHWSDQGLPPGATEVATPDAVTYQDTAGKQRFFVFTAASSGHLMANWWDGALWHWSDQGLPTGTTYVITPKCVTYRDPSGKQRFFVFAEANNGHLVVNWWDGALWHWSDQGLPSGSAYAHNPSPVTYRDAMGNQRFFVFAQASNGHLVANWWDGAHWHWSDQGLPAGATGVTTPSAVTYQDAAGKQHFFVFARGSNGHLVANWWDGALWHWSDQGLGL